MHLLLNSIRVKLLQGKLFWQAIVPLSVMLRQVFPFLNPVRTCVQQMYRYTADIRIVPASNAQ